MDNITVVDLGTGGELNVQDINILEGSFSTSQFNPATDKVELTITNYNGELEINDPEFTLYSVTDDPSLQSTDSISTLNIDIQKVLDYYQFDRGILDLRFDFYRPLFFSNPNNLFYVSEISADRTEVRVDSLSLSDATVLDSVKAFVDKIQSSSTLVYFYLNFGSNQLITGVNLVLDNNSIVVKLYNPLPADFGLKSTLFLTEKVAEPVTYQVSIPDPSFDYLDPITELKGPNLNLDIKDTAGATSNYSSADSLLSTVLTSSYAQLSSILADKGVEINVDYTDYGNFVHYSNAYQRVLNFYQKVSLIEDYQNELGRTYFNITGSTSSSLYVSQSRSTLQTRIDNIVTNFDGYEYFLYFNSESKAWPKTTSVPPYTLATTGSTAVLNWIGSPNPTSAYYGGALYSASLYDELNKDNLLYTVPEYLREDPTNKPYELFVSMVGQHFDTLWLYTKGVTDKLDSDNRPDYGAPKQLMGDILRSFGMKVYTNQFSSEDLYSAFTGITPSGSLSAATGSEVINSYIEASDYIAADDITVEIYKRLYHNLPYLLKKKGSVEGIRALINIFGIPDTVLRISEFGGKDKVEGDDYDAYEQIFNYAFAGGDDGFIDTPWDTVGWNGDNVPYSFAFRFKLPDTSSLYQYNSQSLWSLDDPTGAALVIQYTGTGNVSGSYSGSSADSGSQYAHLLFYPNSTASGSVYLPFNDAGWWSIGVTKIGTTFKLYAGNSIYSGNSGTSVGFYATASVTTNDSAYIGGATAYYPSLNKQEFTFDSKDYRAANAYYQEIRYYGVAISESVFRDYLMNPSSIEGNNPSSSYDEVAFRATLGNELYTGSISVHPASTGSGTTQDSFSTGNGFNINNGSFVANEDTFFLDQPITGIRNRVSDKIKAVTPTLVSGSTLSSYVSIEKDNPQTQTYTRDINYLEVAFSPTNEINDDIISQIGYFNIGDFIGDPRLQSSSKYLALEQFADDYFKKYESSYQINDYIRLIKFYDNTLFKMIKDFVPVRSSLAAGVVIKQHLLERSKFPVPQVDSSENQYSGSLEVETFSGGAGGSVNDLNGTTNRFNVNQSWQQTVITKAGAVTETVSSQEEFYTGEYSGSALPATTGDLSADNPFRLLVQPPIIYTDVLYDSDSYTFEQFLASSVSAGDCHVFYDRGTLPAPKGLDPL